MLSPPRRSLSPTIHDAQLLKHELSAVADQAAQLELADAALFLAGFSELMASLRSICYRYDFSAKNTRLKWCASLEGDKKKEYLKRKRKSAQRYYIKNRAAVLKKLALARAKKKAKPLPPQLKYLKV
jgi:hypothetical protein